MLVPSARFADAAGEMTAMIGDETRRVLRGHPDGVVVYSVETASAEATLSLRRELPPRLNGDRVVLVAKARAHGEPWIELEPVVVPVDHQAGDAFVDIELDLPPALAGADVGLAVIGIAPPAGETTVVRSEPVDVPAAAMLEFGLGVLEPARAQGSVDFSIDACRDDDCERIFQETIDPAGASGKGWIDRRIPLPELEGERRAFVFTAGARSRSAAFSLPVWANPTLYARVPDAGRINLILLSLDTLRADHLTSYGYGRDTAPFIEEVFARGGTLFEHLTAAAATTGPSHMTIFTSLPPSAHGLTGSPAPETPVPVTLAEVLRDHGFATAAITEDGPLHAGWGFSRGFDSYAENRSADVMLPEGHIGATFDAARAWLRRNADRRFFLFLHTFQVHFPYRPPRGYRRLFAAEPDARRDRRIPAEYDPILYDREIRYVDDQLRAFFDELRADGLAARTLFVITSDHGEEFLEHGFIGHGAHLHPEVMRVPLLMRGPGVPAGLRVRELLGHVDLMPTLLDLVDVPKPSMLAGRSLAPALRGDGAGHTVVEPIYSEAWYETAMGARGAESRVLQPTFAVRLGHRKLVRYRTPNGHAYRYFDLAADPDERNDLHAARRDEWLDLRALLEDYPQRMRQLRATAVERRPAPSHPTPARTVVDPAVQEKLRALGYVE